MLACPTAHGWAQTLQEAYEILNELTRIDLIKWIDDFLCLLRWGPGVKLTWVNVSGWPGGRVERILRQYGVRVYRRQYSVNGSDYGLHVLPQQAMWAEYVLRKAGCPLTSPLVNEANRRVQPGGAMPRAWGVPARPVGLAGWIVDMWLRR